MIKNRCPAFHPAESMPKILRIFDWIYYLPCCSSNSSHAALHFVLKKDDTNYWWVNWSRCEAGGWAPALSICWDLTFSSPILLTNAHRCFNIISCGTRCYLSLLAPLRRHLPMFSRHDINSPKEACSLTDSPSWNLTDNDFVFAEARAPLGVGGEMRYGLVFQNLPSLPLP